jgi:hypothetical protein
MTNTRIRQLAPAPLLIEIERLQQAGYDERRTGVANYGWSARLRARFSRDTAR